MVVAGGVAAGAVAGAGVVVAVGGVAAGAVAGAGVVVVGAGVAVVPVSVFGVFWANKTPAGKHTNTAAAAAIRESFCI